MAYTTIKKPTDYFNTKLYTGTGATHSITGVGHQPDMVWIKDRGRTGYNHCITDAVRGATKLLRPNLTANENSPGTYLDSLISFDSDGFTLGADTSNGEHNINSQTYASWNWKANGADSANTDGSISSTVSANTTSGFSIVSYTGNNTDNATVGHGLGAIPSMVITKSRSVDSQTGWMTKHKNLTSNYNLILNGTDASWNPSSNGWVGDLNSSSVFTLKNGSTNGNNANQSGATYIAYCFAEKQGFSKFGSYVGNGNADGTFVYTGFKPAFVMVKRTDTTGTWHINDTKRDTHNRMSHSLFPNLSDSESSTGWFVDYVSNGFKIRDTGTAVNASGGTYIYMTFAEEPLVGDNPATAR